MKPKTLDHCETSEASKARAEFVEKMRAEGGYVGDDEYGRLGMTLPGGGFVLLEERDPPGLLTPLERKRRAETVRYALATLGLERILPDETVQAAAKRWIRGEISLADLMMVCRNRLD